jgi:hypothetical protein
MKSFHNLCKLKFVRCAEKNQNRVGERNSDVGEKFMEGWRHWKPA